MHWYSENNSSSLQKPLPCNEHLSPGNDKQYVLLDPGPRGKIQAAHYFSGKKGHKQRHHTRKRSARNTEFITFAGRGNQGNTNYLFFFSFVLFFFLLCLFLFFSFQWTEQTRRYTKIKRTMRSLNGSQFISPPPPPFSEPVVIYCAEGMIKNL